MLDADLLDADAAAAIEAVADATLTWTPPWTGVELSAPVMYDSETADALGVASPGHVVRYATALLPDLADGQVVAIGAQQFRVAGAPRRIGDGRHSMAALHLYRT